MIPARFHIAARDLPLWLWGFGYLDFLLHTAGGIVAAPGWITLGGTLVATLYATLENQVRWRKELCVFTRDFAAGFREEPVVTLAYAACLATLAASLAFAFFAALKPPHLPQEFDAINYQMGLPQQLLVRRSLAPIVWSVADLWPMALQWGMAPLSAAFATVNKLPQFFFSLGVAACLYRIPLQLTGSGPARRDLLPLFAVMGAHGIVTQLGTGMMDLPQLYLLLLCLSALLDLRWRTAGIALAVYVASKAFNPFQAGPAVVGGLLWLCFARNRFPARPVFTRFLPVLAALSMALLARSSLQSLAETGTPLFPFVHCRLAHGTYCGSASLEATAQQLLAVRTAYGNGRGPTSFLLHLWRVAIPTRGVNNEFDYPLGLPWLLLVVLAGFGFFKGAWRRPLFQLAALFWILWWLNAHQSRWLYPTIAFGLLATLPEQARAWRTLPFLLLLSSGFSLISELHALGPTLRVPSAELQAKEAAKVGHRMERSKAWNCYT
jgi:hypothetical protein